MSKNFGNYSKRKHSHNHNKKMTPRKQSAKNRKRMHDTYTVEIPKRLMKNNRQRFKEHSWS